jgi:hypothetical protein
MLSDEPYGRIQMLPWMEEPIKSWSMQSGAYILVRQGDNRICISPEDLAQLLIGHSNEHRIEEVVEIDDDDNEVWAPVKYTRPVGFPG